MNITELRKISLAFRRVSSNLLNSTYDTANTDIFRFWKFINENELIENFIKNKISGVEYDFRDCFNINYSSRGRYNPPKEEACHIKAQYDYLNFIINEENITVKKEAMRYCCSDKNISTIIQKFFDMAFKPLIDFINDQISMEMIVCAEESRTISGNTFIQNIETVNGSANQQVSGIINSYNTTNDTNSIITLIDKLICSLSELKGVSSDEIDSVKDDLEIVKEQLETNSPKKNRISKALNGIKKFLEDCSMKAIGSFAAGAATDIDWSTLIESIKGFIDKI